ncbi:hypothetical protein [Aeoliella mucimassa]|uniref:Uncharacterized protein n=1 Tax=Aeoliella mucimassa TaxID=2527972 RepID=A0A518AWU7_9BACT|nr:hypothetical protein [Aeoliella mucimassa]QDU59160.1 hypothetical protein Pan181_54010 [Aeoliella mucimassa]
MAKQSAFILVLSVLWTWGMCQPCEAQQVAPDSSEVLLRNIYVPADRPKSWPTDGETYLPIDKARLDKLLAEGNESIAVQSQPQVSQLLLYGVLEGTSGAAGRGAAQIECEQQTANWLSIDTSTLVINSAVWRSTTAPMWMGNNPATNRLAMQVPGSGWLDFRWQCPVSREVDGAREFWATLPKAVAACLVLDLPSDQVPEALPDSGVLISRVKPGDSLPFAAESLTVPATAATGSIRWLLRWGPESSPAWRVRPTTPSLTQSTSDATYDEQITYQVNESGVAVRQVFQISSTESLPELLTVDMPAPLVLRSARWNTTNLAAEQLSTGRVEITLPKKLTQTTTGDRRLTIDAWCPLASNEATSLSQIRLTQLYWQSGEIDVRLASSLRVEDLRLRNVVQLPVDGRPSRRQMTFAKLDSTSSLDLAVARRIANDTINIGRSVQLGLVGTTAICTTEFDRRALAPVQVLVADMVKDWQPTSVSVDTPYEVADWYVHQVDEQRQLVVRISTEATDPTADPLPLRLRVEANRPVTASNGWSPVKEFDILRWRNTTAATSLIAFEVEDGYRLEMNPQPTPLSEEAIPTYLGTLLPASLTAPVFNRAGFADSLQGYLTPAVAELDAVVLTSVLGVADQWKVGHRIECTPRSGSLGAVYVRLNDAAEAPPLWRLAGETTWRIAKRDESIRRNATWALELPRRQTGMFTIEIQPQVFPGLVCTPAVLHVVGEGLREHWMEVRSDQVRTISVASEGWSPTSESWPGTIPLQSTWKLVADDDLDARFVVNRDTGGESLPLAVISQANFYTTLVPQGDAQHQVAITVDNRAEAALQCELPAEAKHIHWHRLIEPADSPDGLMHKVTATKFSMPLVPERDVERFVVEFTLPAKLAHGAKVSLPSVKFDMPVNNAWWKLRYPQEFEPIDTPTVPMQAKSWSERLFGPLATDYWSLRGINPSPEPQLTLAETELPLGAALTASVEFRHPASWQAVRFLLLAAAALVGYLLWNRVTPLVILLAATVALALLLPASSSAWATSLWGGLLLALALRMLERAGRLAGGTRLEDSKGSFTFTATGAMLLLVLCAGSATADESLNASANQAEVKVESILIPMDESGNATSDTRYISSRLFAELLRRQQQSTTSDAWLISSPRYLGTWNTASTDAGRPNQPWELQFDLEVKAPGAVVSLPLQQTSADWSDTLQLDGTPVPIVWSDQGTRLTFAVQRVGKYRARVRFTPTIQRIAEVSTLRMQVLPLPESELRLTVPGQTQGLRVNQHPLRATNGTDEVFEVPLPVSNELLVEWKPEDNMVQTLLPADAWQWVSFTSEEVSFETWYRLSEGGLEGDLVPSVLLDGQPLGLPTESASGSTDWQLVEAPTRIDLTGGEQRIRVRLACQRSQMFGRLRVPAISLRGTSVAKRYVAVTYPTDQLVQVTGFSAAEAPLVTQFGELWPERDEPDFLGSTSENRRPLELSLRPTNSNALVEESIDVGCFDDQLKIRYQGAFTVGRWSPHFHRLDVAATLHVEEVMLTIAGETTPVSFSKPRDDKLLVLFTEQPSTAYQLTVIGTVDLQKGSGKERVDRADIPLIAAASDATARQQITLFAADNRTAKLVDGDIDAKRTDRLPVPPASWQAYALQQFTTSTMRTRPLSLEIRENKPQFRSSLLTTMVRRNNAWIADFGIMLDVRQGTLPEIELTWPDALVGQIDTTGTQQFELVPPENGVSRKLRIRLAQPLIAGEQQRISFRSAIQAENPERVSTPILQMQGAQQAEYYFGVIDAQRGLWVWEQATPTVAPASIEGLLAPWPAARLLKADGAGYPSLTWIADTAGLQVVRVPLVTTLVTPGAGDAITLNTQWFVPALRESTFELHLANRQAPVSVLVDGEPTNADYAEDGTLSLQVPDPWLPHVIELVSTADRHALTQGIGTATLTVRDTTADIEHRIWQLALPTHHYHAVAGSCEARPPLDAAAIELNQLLSASSSTSLRVSLPKEWNRYWVSVLSVAERKLRLAMSSDESDSVLVSPADETDEYEELLARASTEITRLQKWLPINNEPALAVPVSEPVVQQWFVQSSPVDLKLTVRDSSMADDWVRWLLAIGAVIAAAVHVTTRRRGGYPSLSFELGYPLLFFTAVVIGMVWWLWLWPRGLGLILAALAVLAWLRWNRLLAKQ